MQHVSFNVDALVMALDIKRKASGLDWAGIATESGVSASTICRIRTGKNPDANSLAKLVSWCGMDFNHLNVLKGVRSRFCVFGS
jgi:transcriptional regulator with XRE-family HTH domain